MPEQTEFNRQELISINERAGLRYGVNQTDEIEFGELIAKDHFWGSFVDGTTPDIYQMEQDERNTFYAARLEQPDTPAHILGGFLMQTLGDHDGWTSPSSFINKWFGGFTSRPPRALVDSLMGIINSLAEEGLVEREARYYRLHPAYEVDEDFLTPDDDFEEIVHDYLVKRPIGAFAPYCVFNYFRQKDQDLELDTLSPFDYWGVRYGIGKLIAKESVQKVPNDYGFIRLPKDAYTTAGEEQDLLDSRLEKSRYIDKVTGLVPQESLEKRIRGAGMARGPLRKPQQRGRWKK